MDVQTKSARYADARAVHPDVLSRPRVYRKPRTMRPVLHPAIPRVLCPSCGSIMRLSRIDPWPNDSRKGLTTSFECSCGDDYRHTIRERV